MLKPLAPVVESLEEPGILCFVIDCLQTWVNFFHAGGLEGLYHFSTKPVLIEGNFLNCF